MPIRKELLLSLAMILLFSIAVFSWLWTANSFTPSPGKELIWGIYWLMQTALALRVRTLRQALIVNLLAGVLSGMLLVLVSNLFFPSLLMKLGIPTYSLSIFLFEGASFAGLFLAYGLIVYLCSKIVLASWKRN